MRRLLVLVALLLAASVAFAQPRREPRHRQVHPVPAPSIMPDEHKGKEVEEEVLPPVRVLEGSTNLLKNPQPPLAALFFNFAVLVYIYYRFGRKPAAEALKNRKLSIASAIENAQKILREAKDRSKRYRKKLDKVAEDAEQGKQALVSTGKGEAEMLLRTADEKVARIRREAQFLLEQEKKQTELDLVRETVEKAAREAEELLRKNVNAADQERLAEEFITKLTEDFEKGLPLGGAL